ncbi:hypothetical protein [Streptomyces vilmorinianum]|uniref:hypothetical protein n=1 Tax=Streptomyces vilmorinianum TaxID=3051092 RepID=UPI0020C78A6A|nr:hypothetical protein [Streptomyces vilmorinianum]
MFGEFDRQVARLGLDRLATPRFADMLGSLLARLANGAYEDDVAIFTARRRDGK